ncbi:MAG TPA: hypothetical protein DIC36_07920 [Gammaproteobacteria bacterium]|nr:hypothetical protein [Gammaproteobacteria bacterium]
MPMSRLVSFLLSFAVVLVTPASLAAGPSEMILVRSTSKSIDEVVKSIEAYSDKHDWFFLGADKLLGGKITLVKTCIPEVGPLVWTQDMKYTAMLPCGNISLYTQQGKTEIAVLSGQYMHTLVPTAEMKKASDALQPLLIELLNTISK